MTHVDFPYYCDVSLLAGSFSLLLTVTIGDRLDNPNTPLHITFLDAPKLKRSNLRLHNRFKSTLTHVASNSIKIVNILTWFIVLQNRVDEFDSATYGVEEYSVPKGDGEDADIDLFIAV